MDSFPQVSPLWDLSQHIDLDHLQDNEFLALLQKQFPTDVHGLSYMPSFSDGVNPQNLSSYPLPSLTPPSEDSSPSPPNSNQDANEDPPDSALKRKASDEDFSDGPTQKSQHTSDKRSNPSRRKGSGSISTGKDEGRLMKRKEQNRAAQRAFRERKEKHVKDLEDKVAELEAKNEKAEHDNENLRDLLTRLQSENVVLKQSSFTFAVPKNSAAAAAPAVESPPAPQIQNPFSPPQSQQSVASPSASTSSHLVSPKMTNPLDWSSLTTFDPTMLNLLDDSIPQPTATEGAMQMDFGFGGNTGLASNSPYTTIASNPMFMSFASTFDTATPEASTSSTTSPNGNSFGAYNFDMNNLTSWSTPGSGSSQDAILDDLFSGYLTSTGSMDISMLSPTSVSPVAHQRSPQGQASSSSSSSSPSMLGSSPTFTTPSNSPALGVVHGDGCPKTKKDLEHRIAAEGSSMFAPSASPSSSINHAAGPSNLRKASDSILGTMISCVGSNFPKTTKSDKNIEVLSAWRTIRADPKFKDADINDLCSEFTSKAKCDGTKVVLEPSGVHSILENLAKKQ